MIDFKEFLKRVIKASISYDETVKPGIIWKFKYRDDIIYQYKSKVILSGKKHLYLILTKRKLPNDKINIYLETYLTVKPTNEHDYSFSDEIPENLPSYRYRNIRSLYINSHPELLKLYGVVKYGNYLTHTRTKKLFVEELLEWTKKDLIPWQYDGEWFFKCVDLKYENMEIFIKAGRQRIFIFLNGGEYKFYTINNIQLKNSDGRDILYDTIKKNKT